MPDNPTPAPEVLARIETVRTEAKRAYNAAFDAAFGEYGATRACERAEGARSQVYESRYEATLTALAAAQKEVDYWHHGCQEATAQLAAARQELANSRALVEEWVLTEHKARQENARLREALISVAHRYSATGYAEPNHGEWLFCWCPWSPSTEGHHTTRCQKVKAALSPKSAALVSPPARPDKEGA